jgi:hypothetical protein
MRLSTPTPRTPAGLAGREASLRARS